MMRWRVLLVALLTVASLDWLLNPSWLSGIQVDLAALLVALELDQIRRRPR